MAYLTVEEVKNLYPSLREQVNQNTVSETRIQSWIDEAQSLIDSYVGQKYTLPFSDVPALIKTLAIELFEYFWQKSIYTPTSTGEEVPWLYARYDRILKILEQIKSGEIPLIDSEGNRISPSNVRLKTMRSNHLEVDQIFSMKPSWEQEIDENYDKEP